MAYTLDIFSTLSAIDQHNLDWFSERSEEERKGFAPPVVLRWAASTNGPNADAVLCLTNAKANLNFYDISNHPDLQYKLLASCGLGRKLRHEWIPVKTKKKGNTFLENLLSEHYPSANSQEIQLLLDMTDRDGFMAFLNAIGSDDKLMKKAIQEYDRYHGIEKAAGKRTKKS